MFRRTKRPERDRRETWREAADAVGGTFTEGKRPSDDAVAVAHGPWTVALETYTVHTGHAAVTFTRAKALFVGKGDPRVRIRKRNAFDGLLERAGFGGASPDRGPLAERYVVKVRPERYLRFLLTPGLSAALLAESSPVSVRVGKAPRKHRKAYGPDLCLAEAYASGVVKERGRLVGMITIARETLDALEAAGMARRAAVDAG